MEACSPFGGKDRVCSEMPKVAAELVSAENKARTCDLKFRSMNNLN